VGGLSVGPKQTALFRDVRQVQDDVEQGDRLPHRLW
jgi:hypothetical protein